VLDFSESDKTFGLHLRPEEVHLKQIDFEFGFTKKAPGKLAGLEIAYAKGSDDVAPSEPQRLPLVIESNTGSQMNDNIQPNILTSPDSEVFCSNYPQPEFIFKLQSGAHFIPSTFTIRSKENRVFTGIPIS